MKNRMTRGRWAAFVVALVALLIPLPVAAHAVLPAQSGVAHLATINPLLARQIRQTLGSARHFLRPNQAAPLVRVEFIATRDVTSRVRTLGGRVSVSVGGKVTAAELPADRIADLARVPGVVEIFPVHRLHRTLDQSVPEIGASQVWNLPDVHGLPLQGGHVLIADVDTGVDYRNPDFRRSDGTTRIKYIWDQTVDGHAPGGFNFGFECDAAAITSGQCPEKDTDGHGTHVTGIAAGNGLSSNPAREIGVAPQADIIMVKSDLDTDHILAAWKYLIDKAQQLGEPIVINNSFGSDYGPHDGTEPDAIALDALSGPGHIFVASAGNGGNQGIHASGNVAPGGTTSIELAARSSAPEMAFTLFYPVQDNFSVTLTNVSTGESFGPVNEGQIIDGLMSKDRITKVTVDATAWDSTHHSVVVDIDRTASGKPVNGLWRLTINGANVTDGGHFNAWLLDAFYGYQAFVNPDETSTVGDPADAHRVITVANYATRITWQGADGSQHNVCDFFCVGNSLRVGETADHSSVGPTADGRQKPDISAPGTMIISSLSRDVSVCRGKSSDPNDCMDPAQITPDGKNLVETGTSMSAPHVTGVVALMLQAKPTLDPTTAIDVLRTTARHDQFTGTATWTPVYGAGKVNALDAVQTVLAAARPPAPIVPTATARPVLAPTQSPPAPTATTPGPTTVPAASISITGVQVGGPRPGAGIMLSSGGTALKVGTKTPLWIYGRISGLSLGVRVTVKWTVTQGKSMVFSRSRTMSALPFASGQYSVQTAFVPSKAGAYTFIGSVTVNGQQHVAQTTFRAVGPGF